MHKAGRSLPGFSFAQPLIDYAGQPVCLEV